MSETENALLKSEIARLNKIIEALLFTNEDLRNRISSYQTKESIPNLINSIHKTTNGTNETINSIHKTTDGNKEIINSIQQITDGTNKTINSNQKITNGSNEIINSIQQMTDGSNEIPQALPHFIEPESLLFYKVQNYMKRHDFKRSTNEGLIHSAKLLVHIYNRNHCSSVELRKITELSKGGLAKRMMALKNQGYIIRTGKQKFALFEKGMELFKRALISSPSFS